MKNEEEIKRLLKLKKKLLRILDSDDGDKKVKLVKTLPVPSIKRR